MTSLASSRRPSFLGLLQAARGQYVSKLNTKQVDSSIHSSSLADKQRGSARNKPLRCFPLRQEHIGTLSRRSTNIPFIESLGEGKQSESNSEYYKPATPKDFHGELCRRIRGARTRVVIASLYIGPAAGGTVKREAEFLDAIEYAASKGSDKNGVGANVEVKVLLDANRALRRVRSTSVLDSGCDITSSADAVLERLSRGRSTRITSARPDEKKTGSSRLYLFNMLNGRLLSHLPSPLNKVAGIFHLKAYIIDDSLILSGANLSEEYFTNRHDRYTLFKNGGGGLVDFYADLIDVLCEYADEYEGETKEHSGFLCKAPFASVASLNNARKRGLVESLSALFDGTKDQIEHLCTGTEKRSDQHMRSREAVTKPVIAYAVPTHQAPNSFFPKTTPLPFMSDAEVTQNLLLTAIQEDPFSSVRMTSAYLNPTPNLLSTLKQFGQVHRPNREKSGAMHLITAGAESHGFAPKKGGKDSGNGKWKDWIPYAFLELTDQIVSDILPRGGKVLPYHRKGWTFHAKGLWLSSRLTSDISNAAETSIISDPCCI